MISPALAGHGNQCASFGGALIDETVHQGLHLAVTLLAADTVHEWSGRDTWRGQRGHEPVFSQDRPIARVDRIEPMASEARGFAAHIVEWHAGVKIVSHHALFDATFSLDTRLGLGGKSRRRRQNGEKVAALHERFIYRSQEHTPNAYW
jgi:hypothetical protein